MENENIDPGSRSRKGYGDLPFQLNYKLDETTLAVEEADADEWM